MCVRRLVALAALQRRDLAGSMPISAGPRDAAASVIRDRFSPDAWRALTELIELINAPLDSVPVKALVRARQWRLTHHCVLFRPCAGKHEPACRLAISGARPSHRACARNVSLHSPFCVAAAAPDGALDVLLELADSQITYRLRYVMVAARAPVVDLVTLDPNNPRSIAFQLSRIETHLGALPRHGDDSRLSPPEQIATDLTTKMRTADVGEIDDEACW